MSSLLVPEGNWHCHVTPSPTRCALPALLCPLTFPRTSKEEKQKNLSFFPPIYGYCPRSLVCAADCSQECEISQRLFVLGHLCSLSSLQTLMSVKIPTLAARSASTTKGTLNVNVMKGMRWTPSPRPARPKVSQKLPSSTGADLR